MDIKLLKKKMLDKNRDDFGNYLAEILNVTAGAASKKLKEETKFTLEDVKLLSNELNLTIDDVNKIFMGDIE